jgi:hypothetical protein
MSRMKQFVEGDEVISEPYGNCRMKGSSDYSSPPTALLPLALQSNLIGACLEIQCLKRNVASRNRSLTAPCLLFNQREIYDAYSKETAIALTSRSNDKLPQHSRLAQAIDRPTKEDPIDPSLVAYASTPLYRRCLGHLEANRGRPGQAVSCCRCQDQLERNPSS